MKMENRSHRYDINRPELRQDYEHTKYKISLSMIMFMCIIEHLSKI